jgi:multisubunit Na+/H+ antiporter MnhB subunit
MTNLTDVERAERISRSRAKLFALQGLMFIVWQALFFVGETDNPMRTATVFKVSAWLVWAVVLLLLLATGGALLRGRGVRHLLNDELTRMNRARSFVMGFWASALAAIALYIVTMFEPVSGREAIHIILSAGIGAALLTFAARERRSAESS